MELPKKYNPLETEDRIYRRWEKSGAFAPAKHSNKKPFSIAIPPPNITGSLHLGHALNNTIQDALIRYYRMKGKPAVWIPGTDHAGIATQTVVEKKLRGEGQSRHQLGREKFTQAVWQWKEEYGGKILDQLKKMGCSLDWSRLTFTLDPDYAQAVYRAFVHYYQKGWIYQGERVVNWCPRCQSSLSDLEVDNIEKNGKLYFIRYPLKSQISNLPESYRNGAGKSQNDNVKSKILDSITVATTRPETMLGDSAVAVNPKDKKYAKIIGEKVILPLTNREIPIIADERVDRKFGTGAVKVTPAHDQTDFGIGQDHDLDMIKVIDEKGVIVGDSKYAELDRFKARSLILEDLRRQGLLEKEIDHKIILPLCSRCDTVLEPLASRQWFLKMAEIKQPAIEAIKKNKIQFTPVRFKKICLDWLEKSYDWCISRQLWWGHRLPVWYQPGSKSQISNLKSQNDNSKFKIQNSKIYVGVKPPKGEGWAQSEDVLDTWFSSALWTFATLGWTGENEKTADLKKFHPTSVLSTARDIIFLWVARMIFSSLELTGEIPFEKVYIHPTILNEKGQRMSKSLGTGVDPLDLIAKYGADALRFGLIYQNTGVQDLKFSEDAIIASQKFGNKVWNVFRFIDINLKIPNYKNQISNKSQIPKPKTQNDKQILKKLAETKRQIAKNLETFQFSQAAHALYDFIWHNLADRYLEESKRQMEDVKLALNTQKILLFTLTESLIMLHPFMPFITEEIWSRLYAEGLVKEKLLIGAKWE